LVFLRVGAILRDGEKMKKLDDKTTIKIIFGLSIPIILLILYIGWYGVYIVLSSNQIIDPFGTVNKAYVFTLRPVRWICENNETVENWVISYISICSDNDIFWNYYPIGEIIDAESIDVQIIELEEMEY
jgi:hypothetical protein